MTSGAIWSTVYGTKTSSIEKINSENDGFPTVHKTFLVKLKRIKMLATSIGKDY